MCVQYTFSLTEHTEFYYLFPTGLHRLLSTDQITKKQISMHSLLGFNNCDHIDHNELNNLVYRN